MARYATCHALESTRISWKYSKAEPARAACFPTRQVRLECSDGAQTDEGFKLESHLGLPSVKLVVLVDTDAVTAAMHARDRDVRIAHRPTMRELAEQIARVVVELDCVG